MKLSYILTKRKTKTENLEKYLKMCIINFKTIRYKLTASGNINPQIQAYESYQQITAT